MSTTHDFLVELGTEELPPKTLGTLMRAFADEIADGLDKAGLAHGAPIAYAGPRRLAVLVPQLATAQPDREVERRGPALAAAFDADGNPTPAASGFARSCDVDVTQLERLETPKGSWLVHRARQAGNPSAALLPDIVRQALERLPIARRMRWSDLAAEFVRPVHWLVMLFGEQVIDCEILATRSGRDTRGHRFMAPAAIAIDRPADYVRLLEQQGRVIADFDRRRAVIRQQVTDAAQAVGGVALFDEALLDEVTGLVEWPVAVTGRFDAHFLEVPAEALISTMKGHQKYFPVADAAGKLLPYFITLSNIDSRDPAVVQAGNERVIRPRLTDAAFFWQQDRLQPLAGRLAALEQVVFQQKLGSVAAKSRRTAALAAAIATRLDADPALAQRAGELAKCDLLTLMVGEFPELQGVMGRHYALHDGEDTAVADALDAHYQPRFSGDRLPAAPIGQALAIADRLDTLCGIFGIGQPPSGDRDPFALRRAALGVMRILIEGGLDLDLQPLLQQAAERYAEQQVSLAEDTPTQVLDFMFERLRAYYTDRQVAPDTFDAVLALRPTRPADFDARIRAVGAFRQLPEAAALAAANKRIGNILRQAEDDSAAEVDERLLQEPAEVTLAQQLAAMQERLQPLIAAGDYTDILRALAGLRDAVDAFFDQVMVMADDPAIRDNRLALLRQLAGLFLQVADVSRLQG